MTSNFLARGWPALRPQWRALLLAYSLALAGCAVPNPDFKPDRAHHTSEGFQNLPGGKDKPGFDAFLKWQWERWGSELPLQYAERVPRVPLQPAQLEERKLGWQMTWLGHASVHLQVDGLQILIDPVLSGRASPFESMGPKAHNPSPLPLQKLPRVDLVLISHNHYDHLDERTVRALAAQAGGPPTFIVPLGVDRYLRDWGVTSVVSMDWLDTRTFKLPLREASSLTLEMIPAHHWSRRTIWDTNKTLWGGFRLQTQEMNLVYTGDTGYSTIYKSMAKKWPPIDWLLVPVGCYEPRWFMGAQHVDPAEAQQIASDLGAKNAIGVHWGVFRLCDEPVEQPLEDLRKVQAALPAQATRIQMWAIGESRALTSGADKK